MQKTFITFDTTIVSYICTCKIKRPQMEPCGTPYSNMQTCGQTKLSAVFILLILPYSFLYFTSQSNKILFLQFSALFFLHYAAELPCEKYKSILPHLQELIISSAARRLTHFPCCVLFYTGSCRDLF